MKINLIKNTYLAGDGQGVTQLTFARPELSKDLCDGSCLNSTAKESI